MPAPLVIMIGADKGGVGKTTMCRAVADYLSARSIPYRALDTEYPAGGLIRFVPSAEIINIERIEGQMKAFDAMTGITLIDIRAGQLSKILDTLEQAQMLEDVKAGNINLALLHVLGPSVQSLREVSEASAAIGGGSKHFLVKNRISSMTGFFEWEGPNSKFAELLARMGKMTITLPHLEDRAAETTDSMGMSFLNFAQDGGGSRVLKGYVRAWLTHVWNEIDRVGIGALCREAVG
jgi:hypothetical protein